MVELEENKGKREARSLKQTPNHVQNTGSLKKNLLSAKTTTYFKNTDSCSRLPGQAGSSMPDSQFESARKMQDFKCV